jgi:hypothetical protein
MCLSLSTHLCLPSDGQVGHLWRMLKGSTFSHVHSLVVNCFMAISSSSEEIISKDRQCSIFIWIHGMSLFWTILQPLSKEELHWMISKLNVRWTVEVSESISIWIEINYSRISLKAGTTWEIQNSKSTIAELSHRIIKIMHY